MRTLFAKGREVMRRFFEMIFGVPADSDVQDTKTARKYIRADELPREIQSEYAPWRVDPSGVQWMQRVAEGQDVAPDIHGFAPVDDDGDDDELVGSLPDDVAAGQLLLRQLVTEDYRPPVDVAEARENARLRRAARRHQSRMANWPMNDDSADFNDEN